MCYTFHDFSSSISSWGPHVAPRFLQWPRLNKTGQPIGNWFHDPLDRHSRVCLTSLGLTMIDYVPPFNFNRLNTQSTRKREGMDSMGFKMVWWHNGHLTHLSETGNLQNLRLSTHMQWSAGLYNVYIIIYIYIILHVSTYIIQVWWSLLWLSCRLPACSD